MSKRKEKEENDHNTRMIHLQWGKLRHRLSVEDVIHPLIQAGAITLDKWMEIKSKKSKKDQVEDFLSCLLKKPSSLPVFVKVLKDSGRYADLAKDLNIKGEIRNISSNVVNEGNDNHADDSLCSATPMSDENDRRRAELEAIADIVNQRYAPVLERNTAQLAENAIVMTRDKIEKKELEDRFVELLNKYDHIKTVYGDETKLKQREGEYQKLLKENQELKEQLKDINSDRSQGLKTEKEILAGIEALQKETESLMEQKKMLMDEKENLEKMFEKNKDKYKNEQIAGIEKPRAKIHEINNLLAKLVLRNNEIKNLKEENEKLVEQLRRRT